MANLRLSPHVGEPFHVICAGYTWASSAHFILLAPKIASAQQMMSDVSNAGSPSQTGLTCYERGYHQCTPLESVVPPEIGPLYHGSQDYAECSMAAVSSHWPEESFLDTWNGNQLQHHGGVCPANSMPASHRPYVQNNNVVAHDYAKPDAWFPIHSDALPLCKSLSHVPRTRHACSRSALPPQVSPSGSASASAYRTLDGVTSACDKKYSCDPHMSHRIRAAQGHRKDRNTACGFCRQRKLRCKTDRGDIACRQCLRRHLTCRRSDVQLGRPASRSSSTQSALYTRSSDAGKNI